MHNGIPICKLFSNPHPFAYGDPHTYGDPYMQNYAYGDARLNFPCGNISHMHTVSDLKIPGCIRAYANWDSQIPVCIRGSRSIPVCMRGLHVLQSLYSYGDFHAIPVCIRGSRPIPVCIRGSWRSQHAYRDGMTHNPCMHTGIKINPCIHMGIA